MAASNITMTVTMPIVFSMFNHCAAKKHDFPQKAKKIRNTLFIHLILSGKPHPDFSRPSYKVNINFKFFFKQLHQGYNEFDHYKNGKWYSNENNKIICELFIIIIPLSLLISAKRCRNPHHISKYENDNRHCQ